MAQAAVDDANIMATNKLTEQEHFAALYGDHHGWLRTWLMRKLGNAADAADLAHDAFVRVWCGHESATGASAIREPRAYLRTVAQGLVIDLWRRRELEQAYLDALASQPAGHAASPETVALALETLLELDAMLGQLPARTRQAFLLFHLDGCDTRQIASRLNVSDRMVRKYLVQAMAQCTLFLMQQEYTA